MSYSILNIKELFLGYIILQGTYTQDGLIERPLLLSFVIGVLNVRYYHKWYNNVPTHPIYF